MLVHSTSRTDGLLLPPFPICSLASSESNAYGVSIYYFYIRARVWEWLDWGMDWVRAGLGKTETEGMDWWCTNPSFPLIIISSSYTPRFETVLLAPVRQDSLRFRPLRTSQNQNGRPGTTRMKGPCVMSMAWESGRIWRLARLANRSMSRSRSRSRADFSMSLMYKTLLCDVDVGDLVTLPAFTRHGKGTAQFNGHARACLLVPPSFPIPSAPARRAMWV
ncbi:hypothetical protein K491DRAFT_369900 [Lophiostoma macrostomum CBS 122681]|uniref:Uncharacterized protein n=1 Tax=Lophiostoma macrostomum CBS 122681 TaxID=1314788 RepID=A0A6A6TAF4_9PLEO|nr:hypothetical protein K491DRAFT_369900 [Lophiostoma macrostomum CBS 122681]